MKSKITESDVVFFNFFYALLTCSPSTMIAPGFYIECKDIESRYDGAGVLKHAGGETDAFRPVLAKLVVGADMSSHDPNTYFLSVCEPHSRLTLSHKSRKYGADFRPASSYAHAPLLKLFVGDDQHQLVARCVSILKQLIKSTIATTTTTTTTTSDDNGEPLLRHASHNLFALSLLTLLKENVGADKSALLDAEFIGLLGATSRLDTRLNASWSLEHLRHFLGLILFEHGFDAPFLKAAAATTTNPTRASNEKVNISNKILSLQFHSKC